MISGLTYTVRTHGFFGLYRGLAPTLIGSIPKAGIRFGGVSLLREVQRDERGNLSTAANFLAGLGAGVMEALVIVAPVETVKTKVNVIRRSHRIFAVKRLKSLTTVPKGYSVEPAFRRRFEAHSKVIPNYVDDRDCCAVIVPFVIINGND